MRSIVLAASLCLMAAALIVAQGCGHEAKTPPTTSKVCQHCSGSGRLSGTCAVCNGSGQRVGGLTSPLKCESCGGHGTVSMNCPDCAGTGRVIRKD